MLLHFKQLNFTLTHQDSLMLYIIILQFQIKINFFNNIISICKYKYLIFIDHPAHNQIMPQELRDSDPSGEADS